MNLNLHISNHITVDCNDEKVLAHLRKTLTLDNPMFYRLRRMNKSTWQTPEEYRYYRDVDSGVEIPRGMWSRVKEFAYKINAWPEVEVDLIEKKIKDPMFSFTKLRDYQEEVIEKMESEKPTEGLIVMSTGAGKTVVACELVYRYGLTATILVPNTVLLDQFCQEFEKNYGFTPGKIGKGKKEIKDITVATYQSLIADPMLCQELADKTSVLICDEAQSAVSDKRLIVLSKFKPSFLYGLTATPSRSAEDGRTKAIGFIFGDELVNFNLKRLAPEVDIKLSGAHIPTGEYHQMVKHMVHSDTRNKLISGMILGQILEGRKTLVLTKRVEHYKKFEDKFAEDERAYFIDSKDPERNATLRKMKRGEMDFNVIFGTTSLLAVGTDIPSLDTLIIACDMKSDVLTQQAAGRILRLFDGKPEPRIIDIVDHKNPIFKNQFKKRLKIYQANEWRINNLPYWI